MKNKQITYFLIFLALLIVIVITANYINSKPKKSKANPYEYNVDEFKNVDSDLISYKETKQIKIGIDKVGGIASANNHMYLASGNSVKIISLEGKVISEFEVDNNPGCITVKDNRIIVGFKKTFAAYSSSGDLIFKSEELSDSSIITSIAIWNDKIVVADAGKRKVYIYKELEKKAEFEGVSGTRNLHGFIIPSAKFDIAVNNKDELWVVNPGMHSLQQYDEKGNLLNEWSKSSLNVEGFCGCCNPAHFTFLPDGRFVTSEKGMPRIKIYDEKGKLESVVAPPSKFVENGSACDVAILENIIVALDFDKKMIRIFEER